MLRARLSAASGFVALLVAAAGCHDQPADTASESALNANPKTADFVIEADNSIRMQPGGLVVRGGDIGARGASGPYLSGGAAIDVFGGTWSQSSHTLLASSVRLERGAVPGAGVAAAGSAGIGMNGPTRPCQAPAAPVRSLVWMPPTTASCSRRTELASRLWFD